MSSTDPATTEAVGGGFEKHPALPGQHPGEVLLDWIIDSGRTQSWLAQELDVSLKHINHIVRGRSVYSERLALRLGEVTDRPARYWATLRLDWKLSEAERKHKS